MNTQKLGRTMPMKRKLNIEKKTREQVLVELQQDSATWELFGKFKPEHKEELVRFYNE